MNHNLKIYILIGEILIEGSTQELKNHPELEEFGTLKTYEDLSNFLNLVGLLNERGNMWTEGSLKTFCHRMRKQYPNIWDEHIQYDLIDLKERQFLPTTNSKNPTSIDNDPEWVVIDQRLEKSDWWFWKYQQSLPEKDRIENPDCSN